MAGSLFFLSFWLKRCAYSIIFDRQSENTLPLIKIAAEDGVYMWLLIKCELEESAAARICAAADDRRTDRKDGMGIMGRFYDEDIKKSPRIDRLISHLYAKMPVIEADRAVLLTESYRETEGEPVILRRAKAFLKICRELPITIRPEELIVGSNSIAPRGCQVFPEYSWEWLEKEFDTVEKRSADPFYISDETKRRLREVLPYWKGRTTSELATSYMAPETLTAM